MNKKLTAIFAATIFAVAITGCGTESKHVENEEYYPIPTVQPTVDPTPTPTPTTPTPSPTETITVDTTVKTIYYQSNGGNITDVCVDGANNIYFPISSGQNSKIVKYDRSKANPTTENLITGLIKPFSVVYNSNNLYYTTREGSAGHAWKFDLVNKTKTAYSSSDSQNLLDPTYLKKVEVIGGPGVVVGTDCNLNSRFGYLLNDDTNMFIATSSSEVHTSANFFDCITAPPTYLITGSLSSAGGIGVFDFSTLKEVKTATADSPLKSFTTTGKFITGLSYGRNEDIVYSSFQEPGKLNIYTYNPSGDDTILCANGSIPAAYNIIRSTVNPNKFYFTACGTTGAVGVYTMDLNGEHIEKIAGPTTNQPMISPARIIINECANLPEGYEEIIWTCGGGYFDTSTREFNGSQGAVYSKIHQIGTGN